MTHHLGDLPAFPVPSDAADTGISRRDWFAAVALQGLAAKGLEVFEDRVLTDDEKNHIMCTRAYALADKMVEVAAETSPNKGKLRRKMVRRKREVEEATPSDENPAEAPKVDGSTEHDSPPNADLSTSPTKDLPTGISTVAPIASDGGPAPAQNALA